jgi:nitroreductase
MDVFQAIIQRYSCRSYDPRPIEDDKLNKILEAARFAPSANNRQDWRFVVVAEPDTRAKLCKAANDQKFFNEAPVVIAACSTSSHVMTCGQPVAPIDVAIALEHIALQATEVGLATCWIGSFHPDKVKDILGIPEDVTVVELMTLGYPADLQQPAKRQPLEKIASFEKWDF